MYHTLSNKINTRLHLKHSEPMSNAIQQSSTVLSHATLPTIDDRMIIIHKIQQCNIATTNDKLFPDSKRKYLLELVSYFNKCTMFETYTPFIIEMVCVNLFRSLPDTYYNHFNRESDEPNIESNWPHLQLVYEIFHQFIKTADCEILQEQITNKFIGQLINLFDSQNEGEREYLKQIIHILYKRCKLLRSVIRKTMNNILYCSIYTNQQHNGIGEILQIYSTIINRYMCPLKPEQLSLLNTILIPIHKVSFLCNFHEELSYCLIQFIEKDPLLTSVIINGLFKYWPILSTQKQILFLDELLQILKFTHLKELEKVQIPLFETISRLICSNHAIIAQHALLLWNEAIIFECITQNKTKIIPIIYPALQRNYRKHWNANVSLYTLKLTVLINEMDNELFKQSSIKYLQNQQQKILNTQIRKSKWKFIHQMADKNKCKRDQMNANKVHDCCDISNLYRCRSI